MRFANLLKETHIERQTLEYILNGLGFNDYDFLNAKIPGDIEEQVLDLCKQDIGLLEWLEVHRSIYNQRGFGHQLKITGRIDLDDYKRPDTFNEGENHAENSVEQDTINYNDNNRDFWIEEVAIMSQSGKINRLSVGSFDKSNIVPLFSLLIGTNGVGKSLLMREIVDFFIDLHTCINNSRSISSPLYKTRLKGIKYHIDGICCEVIRVEKSFIAKIGGRIHNNNDLRLPFVIACHLGALDKFPVQKVNGSRQTRYDVPYYKYLGAHVNGNMISTSAIIFRLLFALNENIDESQRQNISSILNFIGYDTIISLRYSIVKKTMKDGTVSNEILNRVQKDYEYSDHVIEKKRDIAKQLYKFYKDKSSSNTTDSIYKINIDDLTERKDTELQYIYKLKQYDLVNSISVIFYRKGDEITSDEMSSGEFTMLATVLSISAAVTNPHTLVLLDEPELSLHPNWQMTLIDNLDRALKNKVCHLLIASHSHLIVSDLPMHRSYVAQINKDAEGNINTTPINGSTYGWSAEEVLLKVFKTATDRNRYFGERISKLLEQMANQTINPNDVYGELKELQEISQHLSNVDPMKIVLNTIVETYK